MRLREVSMILAVGKYGELGLNGGLPDWECPGDLKRFKHLTTNKVLIVGRTTLESLPKKMLGRDIICVTTQKDYELPKMYCNSLVKATSLEGAISRAGRYQKEIMVIGGKSLYCQVLGMGLVEYIYLTQVNYKGPADVKLEMSFLNNYVPMFQEEDKLGNKFGVWERDYRRGRIVA